MIAAIVGILGSKWLIGAAGVVAAMVAAFFGGHKVASTAAAGKVQAAQSNASNAMAEAAQAKATVVAVKSADTAEAAAAALPDAALDAELQKRGILK